jgi:DNA-binding transcriptional ArsR family regulator
MHRMSEDPATTPRRPMTAAEAKALGHPTRLKILFACRDEGRTTKQLADALGVSPGTIHHHLQPLVTQGFLTPLEPRTGARGAREQPYLATGRSWELSGTAGTADALRSVATEELARAAPEELVLLARMGMRLAPEQLEQLTARLQAVLDDVAGAPSPDAGSREGEGVRLLLAITRVTDAGR